MESFAILGYRPDLSVYSAAVGCVCLQSFVGRHLFLGSSSVASSALSDKKSDHTRSDCCPELRGMGWGGCGKDWGAQAGGDWSGGCGKGGGDWSGGCGKGGGDWSGGCGKGGGDWSGGGGKGFGGGKGMAMGGMGGGMGGGKGYGAGTGKGGGGGSQWGGHDVWQPMFNAMMSMMKGGGKVSGLRNFTTDRKVWISGMPADNVSKELNMKLKEHMSTAGVTCLYAEIGRSGTGGAAFKSNSEAMSAAAALNGSTFEGVTLQCEMWGTKKV